MSGDTWAIIGVGLLTLVGTGVTARSARRTNTVTVDVRVFEALQEDVVRLQERVELLRGAVHKAEDETDAERRRRRTIEAQVEALTDIVDSMVRKAHIAGIDVDPRAVDLLKYRPAHTALSDSG